MGIYAKLARHAVEHMVKQGEPLPPSVAVPPHLQRQQACFVTLLENPGRRPWAMFGYAMPRYPTLAQEIINHATAILVSTQRRRIVRSDLPNLRFSVAVLGSLQRVSDSEHLDPLRYGLFVSSDRGKSALLLPQRIGVETPNDQIATALREAAIDPRQEVVTMYRFDVEYDDE
jgi:AMMECR1 domain-containing protein